MKGSMMIGLEGAPYVLIKWWRPVEKRFDAEQWMTQRFKALGALPHAAAPAPDGFTPARWVVNLERKEGAGKTIWYGYAPSAGLIMECISTSEVDAAPRDLFFKRLLPRLRAASRTEPVAWSIFSAAFTSPPGYVLTRHRIALGDMALELQDPEGRRLLLRQVFPATLATQRRPLDQWLDTPPFLDRRHLRPEHTRRNDTSLQQRGWKRLPSPMGWLKPRFCQRVVHVDNDRLYIAEAQARTTPPSDLATEAIAAMTRTVTP